jgi:hypothetical protein
MKRPIELVTGLLEGASEPASDRVRGHHGGHDVEIRFVDRGSGSTRDPITEVWFLGAAVRADLRMHVIPQTDADVAEVAQGRGTDVFIDDRAFDEAFFVEAAPEDVIVRLFDAKVRAAMMAARPIGLHTHADGLLLERQGWVEDSAGLRAIVEAGALVVAGIPGAFEAADRAAQSREGYRTTVASETLAAERSEEVATVARKRQAREQHRATMGCIAAGMLTLAITIFAILGVAFCGDGDGATIESYP